MGNSFFSRLIETGEFRRNDEGILFYFGTPTFLIPLRTLISMQRRLEEDHGRKYAAEFMRETGNKQTKRALDRDEERYNFDDMSREKIQDFMEGVSNSIALGVFEFKEVSGEGLMAVQNKTNPFARIYKKEYGETDEPIDFFIEGLFENPLGALTDQDTYVEEVSCMAQGDDKCIFVLRTRD